MISASKYALKLYVGLKDVMWLICFWNDVKQNNSDLSDTPNDLFCRFSVDFNRAVKACTGQLLNRHLIHVVFQLFDRDGDGKLSQQEFFSVMKDRLHRGAKVFSSLRKKLEWRM